MSALPSAVALPVPLGSVFAGKYRVERLLGSGGMGVVVAARHLELDQLVAIKFVRDAGAAPDRLARFLHEGRVAAKIKGEHVARVLDMGQHDGLPYIVFEHLEGRTLHELVARDGPLPVARAVDFVVEAAEAVAEAHALGLIHRDLKPANLFLAARGDGTEVIKVLDFGIAKSLEAGGLDEALTRTADVLGSPKYMAPEQLRSARHVTARVDVWALGVVLYELLAGATPFEGSAAEISSAILNDNAPSVRSRRAEVPAGLARVIARCLEPDPIDRYATIAALAVDVAPYGSAAAARSLEGIVRWARAPDPAGETDDGGAPGAARASRPDTLVLSAVASTGGRARASRRARTRAGALAAIVAACMAAAFVVARAGSVASPSAGGTAPIPPATADQAISSAPVAPAAIEPAAQAPIEARQPESVAAAEPSASALAPRNPLGAPAPGGTAASKPRPLLRPTASPSIAPGGAQSAPDPGCPDPRCARQ